MKKENNLKIIIVLLSVIIILLIGFMLFFMYELIDERNEMREELSTDSDRIYFDSNDHDRITNENQDTTTINNESNSHSDITSSNSNNNPNYISKEKALKTALDDAKISQNDIREIEVELDYKYNKTVYEVTFNYQQYEYEYYINAENGNILKSFRERD